MQAAREEGSWATRPPKTDERNKEIECLAGETEKDAKGVFAVKALKVTWFEDVSPGVVGRIVKKYV
jgi:hypothetical protein